MKAAQQEESPMMANAGGEETKMPRRWDEDKGGETGAGGGAV